MKLLNDIELVISTGLNRNSKKWKNKKILWSSLLERLKTPHHTHETEAEYQGLTKDEKDEIKDVGGFVGGNITGGRRKKNSVSFRTLLTLDIDYPDADPWTLYGFLYSNAAAIYSTHSHTEKSPRYRLVIPLDRRVTDEEYEPIARRVAGDMGIETFDNTTFQTERLMYWPSTCKDGEYVFEHQDGDIMCADDVLATYIDWNDSSQWPVSDKMRDAIKRGIKKQEHPHEKPGVIGAFCRKYDIPAVIDKYLADVYEQADNVEDRYTYLNGSTAGGLIVYDDVFTYSHHGTDPTSGQLCNAFDLVRIHLYGLRDEDMPPGMATSKRPSFKAMRELALKDEEVKQQLMGEKVDEARSDFEDVDSESLAEEGGALIQGTHDAEEEPEANRDWLKKLELDEQGKAKATINNVVMILKNDERLKDRIAIDIFRNNMVKKEPFKWVSDSEYLFGDGDLSHIRHRLERLYGITGRDKIQDAIEIIARKNLFHPVRDYLNGLVWDGVSRIDTLLIKLFGAENNDYTKAVIRKWLTAAVARVMKPGCKFDYMLILHGPQGFKKSMFFEILGGAWFNESLTFSMIGKKESVEQLQGSWIIEVQELDGMNKKDSTSVKNYVAIKRDELRPAYGRYKMEYKRQGVFAGTSNEEAALQDPTGGRRYWPVKVFRKISNKGEKALRKLRNQIWAEALELYKAGEPLYLSDALEAEAAIVQDNFTEKDTREDVVRQYLNMLLPDNWENMNTWERREYIQNAERPEGIIPRDRVTVLEVWQELFGGTVMNLNKQASREVNNILRNCKGWEPTRFGRDGMRERGFRRVQINVQLGLTSNSLDRGREN